MKIYKIFAVLAILACFATDTIRAQALVSRDFGWLLITHDAIYHTNETQEIITPSGNILHKQVFQINPDDSLVPGKGVNQVSFKTWIYHEGSKWTLVDVKGLVFADGKCIIIFHSNGAGDSTPRVN